MVKVVWESAHHPAGPPGPHDTFAGLELSDGVHCYATESRVLLTDVAATLLSTTLKRESPANAAYGNSLRYQAEGHRSWVCMCMRDCLNVVWSEVAVRQYPFHRAAQIAYRKTFMML